MTASFYGCIVPETNAGFYADLGYEPEGLEERIPRPAQPSTAVSPYGPKTAFDCDSYAARYLSGWNLPPST